MNTDSGVLPISAMRKLLLILFTVATLPLSAQEARPARVIKKTEVKKPEIFAPAPEPRKGLMERLFGRPSVPAAKPTPAPTPTPAPVKQKPKLAKPRPKPPVTPDTETTETPAPAAAVKPTETAPPPPPPAPETPGSTPPPPPPATGETPAPAETPKPVETPPAPPVKGTKGKKPVKPANPDKPDLSSLDETARYQAVKATALKDEAIQSLKSKADSTIDANEAKEASIAYNRALFKKIRALEPSLDAYVERLEQAVLKRVK